MCYCSGVSTTNICLNGIERDAATDVPLKMFNSASNSTVSRIGYIFKTDIKGVVDTIFMFSFYLAFNVA